MSGIDYAAVLREIGFDSEWVARGARLIASESSAGSYPGFRTMVTLMKVQGAFTVWRDHQVEPVVRRVEAQEAAGRLSERSGAAGLRVAARRAEEADERAQCEAREAERDRGLREVMGQMTEDEYEGRVPLRPQIAESLRECGVDTSGFRVASRPRPSWEGRAPGPKSPPADRRLRESGAGPALLERTSATGAEQDTVTVQIIRPGWGSSGFYSREVLQQAAADRVIPAGTHMHLDHPTASERQDRPERSVRDLAAVLTEDASWDETRQALVAPARLLAPYAEEVRAKAPHIGVSILGSATDITMGEAEGRQGPIIAGLAKVDSVDFVTHAGREGRVLFESKLAGESRGLGEMFQEVFGLSEEAAKRAAEGR